jgi:DNA-binding CsgD family transcriptional regulator
MSVRIQRGSPVGRSNERIGEGLCIDPGTARNHVSHILVKMGVSNRV